MVTSFFSNKEGKNDVEYWHHWQNERSASPNSGVRGFSMALVKIDRLINPKVMSISLSIFEVTESKNQKLWIIFVYIYIHIWVYRDFHYKPSILGVLPVLLEGHPYVTCLIDH